MADANLHREVQTTAFKLIATPASQWRSPLGPFDGRSAVDAEDDCNIITTPFDKWVPEFPRIAGREVVTYQDGLWGPQEYTRWPQVFNEAVFHHACIPTPGSPYAPSVQVYEGFGYRPWTESKSCGVHGFGFLNTDLVEELFRIAREVLVRYNDAETSAIAAACLERPAATLRLGRMLGLLLRNAVDRLRKVPTTEHHALVTGRMAHRIILEICGLTIYYTVVLERMRSVKNWSHQPLAVLGAFIRNSATAQLFFRVGIPFWLIQPWREGLMIRDVVLSRPWASSLNNTPASPRIPKSWYDPDGTHQDPSRWTHASVIFVCNTLCSSSLPQLPTIVRPATAEREAKRFKGNDIMPMLPPAQSSHASGHNAKKRGKRARGTRSGANVVSTHPATHFQPPPRNVYYLPPPFIILDADQHKARYIHNYVRIRDFLRHRLVDAHVSGHPLRISEWRHVLYGDYPVAELQTKHQGDTIEGEGTSQCAPRNGLQILRAERRAAVGALCGKVGGLLPYDAAEVVQYRGIAVDMVAASLNRELLRWVTWELHEVNWRCELRALDNRLVNHSQDAFAKWEREQLIADVWRGRTGESGFSAVVVDSSFACWTPAGEDGWRERRANLRAFVSLMSVWPDFPPALRGTMTDIAQCENSYEFKQTEAAAIQFYVTTFTSTFYRLPCPPVVPVV
ncbi:uncharacterized protein B0H18DRAFT_950582 [Fomitopsis serialis]|uniref:uncharacterized protein n=1 Tax=Fomitopsis serialis TaxID=139415 RepID=UPI0020084F1A|nr:uncharacterized protein B0H18DRAFT_950582 [Neoantrodia serialis]KAH9936213.1 hypothetical protein B0H18DRAFT_950582 [Neoantrodia serialis]